MKKQVFYHSGDAGDIVASLLSVRQLGGGKIVIGPGPCRESMAGARFESIKPLLECQPYVTGVEWSDVKPDRCLDFSTFRHDHRFGESLAHWQARHLGIDDLDTSPWLTVPAVRTDQVVFARSKRYHNGFFPWFGLLDRYPSALFVGTDEEFRFFGELHKRPKTPWIAKARTNGLLDLARLIAGGRLFCGNQSCPWWIACGLGVTTFQETWEGSPDSMIKRPNAFYMTDKTFDLDLLPE